MNSDIHTKLRERREAFKTGDSNQYKKAKYNLRKAIKQGKTDYKNKLESQYGGPGSDTRQMWQGLRTLTGHKGSSGGVTDTDPSLPDELNNFYARFERDNTTTASKTPTQPEDYALQLSESEVCRSFRRVKAGKSAGPDGTPPRVFKTCADQLAPVFTDIYNTSLQQAVVPVCFKQTTIVPIPKKTRVTGLNDYRPVALTPIAMKCMEKLVLTHINDSIPDSLDPLQFAYRPNRSVDDAISLALHTTLEHLDKGNSYVRMLFIDYSSAFNTIIPAKLVLKPHPP